MNEHVFVLVPYSLFLPEFSCLGTHFCLGSLLRSLLNCGQVHSKVVCVRELGGGAGGQGGVLDRETSLNPG